MALEENAERQMPRWRIETESGSVYVVRKVGSEWRLSVLTPPSSPQALDLRGRLLSIVEPVPWPPSIGQGILILMEWAPGHIKIRGTTPVVKVDGPAIETKDIQEES